MHCFDTFRGFLHKLYAATMDGKGQEGAYNFFLTTTGGGGGQPEGSGHRAQPPLPPRCRRPCHPQSAMRVTPHILATPLYAWCSYLSRSLQLLLTHVPAQLMTMWRWRQAKSIHTSVTSLWGQYDPAPRRPRLSVRNCIVLCVMRKLRLCNDQHSTGGGEVGIPL